jgi:hypothetical protein
MVLEVDGRAGSDRELLTLGLAIEERLGTPPRAQAVSGGSVDRR